MSPIKLPYDKFLESFKLAPRIAVDLWVRNEDGAVLYLKRDIEPFKGMWHLPGSFLLLSEKVEDCIKRLAKEELNLRVNGKGFKLLWLDEDLNEPRWHILHLVYSVKVTKNDIKETKSMKFFFKPPSPMIPNHRDIFLNVS